MKRELKEFTGLVVIGGLAKIVKKTDSMVVASVNCNQGKDSKDKPDWINIAFVNKEGSEPGKGAADRFLKTVMSVDTGIETIDDIMPGAELKGNDLRVYDIQSIVFVKENGEYKNYYANSFDIVRWKPKTDK